MLHHVTHKFNWCLAMTCIRAWWSSKICNARDVTRNSHPKRNHETGVHPWLQVGLGNIWSLFCYETWWSQTQEVPYYGGAMLHFCYVRQCVTATWPGILCIGLVITGSHCMQNFMENNLQTMNSVCESSYLQVQTGKHSHDPNAYLVIISCLTQQMSPFLRVRIWGRWSPLTLQGVWVLWICFCHWSLRLTMMEVLPSVRQA